MYTPVKQLLLLLGYVAMLIQGWLLFGSLAKAAMLVAIFMTHYVMQVLDGRNGQD